MKVLLDTNIVIHREASRVIIEEIGVLFRWLDRLRYEKYIHPVTVQEINKLSNKDTRVSLRIKLESYIVLQAPAALHADVMVACVPIDTTQNDSNDTLLINEVYNNRVDILITEDKKIRRKGELLGISERVFGIDAFLEKVIAENPEQADYRVLSVRKDYFGNIDLADRFFESLKEDYPDFENWFNTKSQETAYVCRSDDGISAFLYLKLESEEEAYPEITPVFARRRRLKVGTFKALLNRHMIGERLLKIIFDNAIRYEVDEIYVTLFDKRVEQRWLRKLFEDFGFAEHGIKHNRYGDERVFVRGMGKAFNHEEPKLTYPYFSKRARAFIAAIYPEYHTDLFPDSILRNESPQEFIENEPFRNAISKVFVSRSFRRDLRSGDLIVFYRTGGYHKSVVTTIGIVEGVVGEIRTLDQFIELCRTRSVFSREQLVAQWDYQKHNRPFIVNFLYAYSFPKRPNLKRLIEVGVIRDIESAPRGFDLLSSRSFDLILKETATDDCVIVD